MIKILHRIAKNSETAPCYLEWVKLCSFQKKCSSTRKHSLVPKNYPKPDLSHPNHWDHRARLLQIVIINKPDLEIYDKCFASICAPGDLFHVRPPECESGGCHNTINSRNFFLYKIFYICQTRVRGFQYLFTHGSHEFQWLKHIIVLHGLPFEHSGHEWQKYGFFQ